MAIAALTFEPFNRVVTLSSDATVDMPLLAGSTSDIFDCRSSHIKTFFFQNTSDRQVSIQAQGSPDIAFSEIYTVGTATTLGVGSVTSTRDYVVLTDYFPYIRFTVTAAASDSTTGNTTIKMRAQGV